MNVLEKLCVYDTRNPNFNEPIAEDMRTEPRNGCFCDNCFYGRDALAVEILSLRSELDLRTAQLDVAMTAIRTARDTIGAAL